MPVSSPSNVSSEAPRLRRPRWRDPRLIVGLLLVLGSVVGVSALLQSQRQVDGYWAARHDIAPGTAVTAEDFVAVEANLADASSRYLSADQEAPSGAMVVATVRAGELVPVGGVADVDPGRRQSVGLSLPEPLAEGVGVGDRVDVWVAQRVQDRQAYAEPSRLATGVEVSEIVREQGGFGGGGEQRIQVLIGPQELSDLLTAKVQEARITVVPTLGGH